MSLRWSALLPLATTVIAGGCFPYSNHDGDYYAGPVDPKNFPSSYKANSSTPNGDNAFVPNVAAVKGGDLVGYYLFPVLTGDPITLRAPNGDGTFSDRPLIYAFDGSDGKDTTSCKAPKDYVYDQQRDFVRFDHQGNVFQQPQTSADAPALPNSAYNPIYAEAPVVSNGEDCQSIHSADGLVASKKVTVQLDPAPIGSPDYRPTGHPDGKYIAAAMIDPSAEVYLFDPAQGIVEDPFALGPQRWGWYDHFLTAYVDGGYVPTTSPDGETVVAQEATLWAPSSWLDEDGNPTGCDPADPLGDATGAPCVGIGWDVLQGIGDAAAVRGQAGYSPLCHVRTYTPTDLSSPAVDPDDQQISAGADDDAGVYVYCLQVAQ